MASCDPTSARPGRIFISGLSLRCIIGILPEERSEPQRLELDIEMESDIAAAAATDAIERTVDYAAVAELVRGLAAEGRYRLVETLVADACDQVLARFPGLATYLDMLNKAARLEDPELIEHIADKIAVLLSENAPPEAVRTR